MTDSAPEVDEDGVPIPVPPDPVTVDRNDPMDVMRGLGFSPDSVQAVVVTRTGMTGISADYPPSDHTPATEPDQEV